MSTESIDTNEEAVDQRPRWLYIVDERTPYCYLVRGSGVRDAEMTLVDIAVHRFTRWCEWKVTGHSDVDYEWDAARRATGDCIAGNVENGKTVEELLGWVIEWVRYELDEERLGRESSAGTLGLLQSSGSS